MEPIRFWVNDKQVEARDLPTTTTLLDFIRAPPLSLTGTKEGCKEGDCGACTVAFVEQGAGQGQTFRAVNSCLVLLPMVHGRRIYTVEGLRTEEVYHPSQAVLAEAMGSQCGYCTPGIVMSLFEVCYREDITSSWQVDDQLAGNLCRCTGYRPIRDAARQLAGSLPADRFIGALALEDGADHALAYESQDEAFFAPTTWEELQDILASHREVRFVCGATDLGLDVTKRHARYPCLVSVERLPGMKELTDVDGGWRVGAALPLSDLESASETRLPIMARMLRFFGARQIKNRATLGGNLCNASPIGDTPPVLLALEADVIVRTATGERSVGIDDFFEGYRKTALKPGEVVCAVRIPDPPAGALLGAYKVSKRRELDISAVCAAMHVRLDDAGTVMYARLAYGGMAATPARASQGEAALLGQPWNEATVRAAMGAIGRDFQPIGDHRGSAWYRAEVAGNLLLGFWEECQAETLGTLPDRPAATVVLGGAP